jgi:hypothetical protein
VSTLRIALVSETEFVPFAELARVSAAVQKQVADDFGPAWGVRATVDPLASLADLTPGYWPVVVRDDIGVNLPGVHWNDTRDKPFALVTYREEDWPHTVSHEVLEMISDPLGKTFVTGPSLVPGQGTVEYLAEVCDPCQDPAFGYAVNGVVLADFVLPAYYKAFGSGRYSFAGNVTEPRAVLKGGYVSWRDPVTENWGQFLVTRAGPAFRDLGPNPAPLDVHLRGFLDRDTTAYLAKLAAPGAPKPPKPRLGRQTPKTIRGRSAVVRKAEGERWRRQIDRLLGTDGRPSA